MNEFHNRIVRVAECVTNEMLASACTETEYRFDLRKFVRPSVWKCIDLSHTNPHPPTHLPTYTHTHIPWIRKFVMARIGCGISHKGTKHTDKCSNNTSTFPEYSKGDKKQFDIKYTHIVQGPYNKQ
jgi:hypothetical protein